MSSPPIRYASGDVEIAYQVLGDGPIDIVWVAGAITHLDVLWEHAGYRRFCEHLALFSRLILFDKRGMGLSERTRSTPCAGSAWRSAPECTPESVRSSARSLRA